MIVAFGGNCSNKNYRKLSSLSDEGARKDLNELVGKNILDSRGRGKNTHYILKRVGDSGNYLVISAGSLKLPSRMFPLRLTPDLLFRGSYFLDFVGFRDMYSEKDLDTAILREMEGLRLKS